MFGNAYNIEVVGDFLSRYGWAACEEEERGPREGPLVRRLTWRTRRCSGTGVESVRFRTLRSVSVSSASVWPGEIWWAVDARGAPAAPRPFPGLCSPFSLVSPKYKSFIWYFIDQPPSEPTKTYLWIFSVAVDGFPLRGSDFTDMATPSLNLKYFNILTDLKTNKYYFFTKFFWNFWLLMWPTTSE